MTDYGQNTDNRRILDSACNALRIVSAVYKAHNKGTPLKVRHPRNDHYISVRVAELKSGMTMCELHGGGHSAD